MKWMATIVSLLALGAGHAPPLELVQTIRVPELTGGTNHLAVGRRVNCRLTRIADRELSA